MSWNVPPGCTQADLDRAAEALAFCDNCQAAPCECGGACSACGVDVPPSETGRVPKRCDGCDLDHFEGYSE